MHIGPFDWIFLVCVTISAIFLAFDTAVKQNEPKSSFAEKLPGKSQYWGYLPLVLMVCAALILTARAFLPLTASKPEAAPSREQATSSLPVSPKSEQPDLHITMLGANIFVPDNNSNLTGLALEVQIWNTGTPTFATEWSLIVSPQGIGDTTAQWVSLPERMTISGAMNSVEMLKSSGLDEKLQGQKVGSAPVRGTLMFLVPISKSTVSSPSTNLRLSVKDIYGKETPTVRSIKDWLSR